LPLISKPRTTVRGVLDPLTGGVNGMSTAIIDLHVV
jgi:hypothetical protein